MLDLTPAKRAHVEQRLRDEPIIWLASVRPDGRPHLVPVWFLWDGATLVIFSKPANQKIRNLLHSPHVVLALDTADEGEDVVLIEGQAELLDDRTIEPTLPAYAQKYATLLARLGTTAEAMAAEYTHAIRVRINRFVMP
jgi:PPOX class probable F420-dependent enzyme